ncbi:hypothetical protein OVA11_06120 [Caulobacter sp. SL161]|uniref:hypothetical protein n=1 Tax=Caulobacter sp. SL161 TaxID=2995156 RepID=UPI002272617B|nr:hypothetical protein [Caulobacter sp. SL161]MCY1646665.1 hypothetical protein [Caulobacter sp. SL161]
MSLLSTPCWTAEDARSVLRTEALSGADEVFLATHTPVQDFDIEGSHASDVETATESGLLMALANPRRQHGLCVIQGEPGSGKSHIIRWLDVNWPEESDLRLLIQRANGSLDGTLRQLQRKIPDQFQHLFDGLKQQQAAGLVGRSMQFLTSLAVSLRPDYFDSAPEDVEWCRKYEPEKLILNALVRENWKGPRRVLEIMNGGDARNSESASFSLKDVYDLVEFCPDAKDSERSAALARRLMSEGVHIREALEEGRSWDDISNDSLALPESLKLVDALNARRNHAVQHVIGVSADALKRLFEELRSALKKEGRRLVLLLEDVTTWQGVDDSLIDVLVTDAATRPEQDLCPLISVIGVTPDYYERDLKANYQQRITIDVRLGKSDGRFEEIGTLKDSENRAGFVARYLAASRAGSERLKLWREDVRAQHNLRPPNLCETCPRHDPCIAAFGEINGIGLFPFTREAVDGFFGALKSDARGQTYKTPRGMLQGVLTPTLLNTEVFVDGQYPGPQIERAYIQKVGLAPLLASRLDDRVEDEAQRARLRRLFAYWGDNRPGLTEDPDGQVRYAGLRRSVVEAFDLPWIADDIRMPAPAVVTVADAADIGAPETVEVRVPQADPNTSTPEPKPAGRPLGAKAEAGPRPATARQPAPAHKPAPRRELEKLLAEIDNLQSDDALPNAPRWNALVHEVMQTIDIRRLQVDRWTFDKVFTPDSVKIAGAGKIDPRHMEVPRKDWLAQGLKAYAMLKTDDAGLTTEEIEHARRRLAALVRQLERLAGDHLDRRLPSLATGKGWRPARAAVQVLLARAWLRGAVSPNAPLSEQWRALLSDEGEAEAASSMRTMPWQEVLSATGRRHGDLRSMLQEMVSLPQGKARNFGLADLSVAAAAMVDLARSLKLDDLPLEADAKPAVSELPVLREVAIKVATSLPRVTALERTLLSERSNTLLPLLRDNSVAEHLNRIDKVVRTVAEALPTRSAVEVREWFESYARLRRILDDRPLLGRLQTLLIEATDPDPPRTAAEQLAWLIAAPASELRSILDQAQRGEAIVGALAPHVHDLISATAGGADLAVLHGRGQALKDAAAKAQSALTIGNGQ